VGSGGASPGARPATPQRSNQPQDQVSDLVPPPDEEEIPDDYGNELDPALVRAAIRDPEEMAIALLTSQLGAKRLEP